MTPKSNPQQGAAAKRKKQTQNPQGRRAQNEILLSKLASEIVEHILTNGGRGRDPRASMMAILWLSAGASVAIILDFLLRHISVHG